VTAVPDGWDLAPPTLPAIRHRFFFAGGEQ
jgi:hypothetical protein